MTDLSNEPMLSVQAIAERWNLCPNTIRSLFRDEPGVMRINTPKRGTRACVTLRIPESVVARVYRRLAS